ncbi:50S ribosomal protein L35 [bacterium]|nr:50S ribosomal protein L35 [bacterium]MBU1984771.1 50S ribosomal protein L35 [bacterium]
MPKMKTRRSAAKRFRLTGSGRLKYNSAYKRHMLSHKSRKRKRSLQGTQMVHSANVKQIQRMLGGKIQPGM